MIRTFSLRPLLTVIATAFLLAACSDKPEDAPQAVVSRSDAPLVVGPVQPLPRAPDIDPRKVELGRRLFHDPRLSGDGTIACANCHAIANYGVDGRRVSVGIGGQSGPINAPTVLNSGFNFLQFWDGRAATLEDQAGGPIENPLEMGAKLPQVIAKLRADPALDALFREAYGAPLDERLLRLAIADYERSLVTPDAPFDRYLRGETEAISGQAREGWRLFRELGCVSCHQGVNVGGNLFATFGVMGGYFANRAFEDADLGRFNVTGREEDRFQFKVPSLRNVAKTAPYFHDGRVTTLEEAVEVMARTQLGLDIEPENRDRIVAFLKSLTGQLPIAP